MDHFTQTITSSIELPEFAHDRDALLGFRVDITNGRSAVVNPTRASSMDHRQAARFCRHGVGG